MSERYEYHVVPALIVLDRKEAAKYFGLKGAGSKAFLREQSEKIAVEVHEYDTFEGVYTKRLDKGEIK
jgi:hypothetical protein|tara:strand:+ start:740 stop:943 length:204 start_codon:yes stop_codon:yes gene_type:complete